MSATLTESEREALRHVVWPVDPELDPGHRDLFETLLVTVERIIESRVVEARAKAVIEHNATLAWHEQGYGCQA